MTRDRLDIANLLRSLSGDRFHYVPNTGNAGDGLIAYATLQAFRRLALSWVVLRVPEDAPGAPPGTTIVIGGGGHMTCHWNGFATLARTLHRCAKRLVILPHTIEANEDILAEFGENVDVVCREETSYEHVRTHARNGCRVHLSDDMAFHLDASEALRGMPRTWFVPLWPLWQGNIRHRARRTFELLQHEMCHERGSPRTLNCFRSDQESAGWPIPRDNIDVSCVFASHDARYGEAEARRSATALVRYVHRFDVVNTDRLHVGIVGALLGKRVRLHAGNYFKVEAVFRYSMRDRFPNVSLVRTGGSP